MTNLVPENEQQYGSILTVLGENAEQNGKLLNKQVEFTHIAFGDANDTYVQPDRKAQALVNELHRIPVNSVDVLQPTPDSVPILKVEAILPDDINDVVIREFAAVATFNGQTYFHAIGNCARVYVPKPINNGNVSNPVTLEMTFVITSADPIVEMDPNVVTASRAWSFDNLVPAMRGDESDDELDKRHGSDQVAFRRSIETPYVSIANRLRAQKLNLVGDLKAPDDNTGDVGQIFQEFLEFGGKKLEIPDGLFRFVTPVLIHGSSGFSIETFGPENTIFTAGSDLLMDTNRLVSLDVNLPDEYAKRAIFHITQFDGENGRPGKAARNHLFSGIGFDFRGTPAEKLASLVASPNMAHSQFMNVAARGALSIYEAWNLSDNTSNHYHLLFKGARSIDCVHHIKNAFKESASTSFGTTWILDDNSISRCKYGYELFGLNYSTIRDSSVDNQLNGAYAVDVYKGRGITIRNVGVETRLHHIDETTGGGILRADNTNIDISSGFFVGGDRDGKGTGDISDYDDGSGNVSDSLFVIKNKSVIKWDVPTIDVRKGVAATPRWPIYVEGDSRLEFVQAQDGFGDVLADFDVKDTSTVEVTRNDGSKSVIFGPDVNSKFIRMSHYVADYFDNERFVAENESIDNAVETMTYRVNFGELGLDDYTVLGMPEDWAFGQLQVTATDLYVTQEIILTKDTSPVYRRISVDRGQNWKAWVSLG